MYSLSLVSISASYLSRTNFFPPRGTEHPSASFGGGDSNGRKATLQTLNANYQAKCPNSKTVLAFLSMVGLSARSLLVERAEIFGQIYRDPDETGTAVRGVHHMSCGAYDIYHMDIYIHLLATHALGSERRAACT